MTGRPGTGRFVRRVQMRGRKTNDAVKPRSRGVRRSGRRMRAAVEMSEREQKLDRQREKREVRPKPDV